MESTSKFPHHHHYHQQQQQHPALLQVQGHQQLLVSSTSTTLATSGYGAALSSHAWSPNTILSNGGFGSAANTRLQNDILSTHQDLSFGSWANNSSSTRGNDHHFTNQSSSHDDLQLELIKREFSQSYTNFSEMISSCSPSSSIEDVQILPIQSKNDPNASLLHRSLMSSGAQNIDGNFQPFQQSCPKRSGSFSQIYPTINVSEINNNQANSSNFDMNSSSQGLNLLNTARFSGIFSQPMLLDQLSSLSKNGSLSYGYHDHYLKPSINPMPILEPINVTPLSNGSVTEAKRPDFNFEPKASQAAPKRSRSESRASCPPFKVRKEKLGDRIAALQQLVAPFGKTDTASVLMEAIGYIKFLQSQVETLSVPYLKSSRNKNSRTVHGGSIESRSEERDLRSRGLCLVPVSCMSYVTDGGGGVWPPPC